MTMEPKDRLIFALDVPHQQEAERLAQEVGPEVGYLKIGLELYLACGPSIVRSLSASSKIFLDLKLHDIPETVGRAAASVAALSPALLTVHACDGEDILKAAVEGAPNVGIVAVTVLTSVPKSDDTLSTVLRRAELAARAGCFGVVASGQEAGEIKKRFGGALQLIVPGVRPKGAEANDQKRVVTPKEAIQNGADLIVVGRPIRDAKDPKKAAQQIAAELS